MPTNEQIRELQELVLNAVLTRQPLPGTGQAIDFPDLAFITRQPEIYLSGENLAGPLSATSPSPQPLRILSAEELKRRQAEGEIAYLEFHYRVLDSGEVELTLEGKLLPGNGSRTSLGLSSMHAVFVREHGSWRATAPPTFLAS